MATRDNEGRPTGPRLDPAQLEWQQDTPVSRTFDDIYFNRDGGSAETEHVFLAGNDLPERWTALDNKAQFTLAETGFGTGLNFLCARKLWLDSAPAQARLHYISCEKYPLSSQDLARALAGWTEFSAGAEQLLDAWPLPCRGVYRLSFDEGRITLTLLFGDAIDMLSEYNASVDAWFLDGFAPSRNPQMWNDDLYRQIAGHSHPGTSFATFTAAGQVRRGLEAAGFAIEKRPGFGRKREMLSGRMQQPGPVLPTCRPWQRRPEFRAPQREAIIIGAGLAGACTAYALARRGWRVRVLERHAAPAQEGSGNPQGALFMKLPAIPTRQSELHLAGFHYTCALLKRLLPEHGELGELCGLLSLALDAKEQQRQQTLIDSATYPDELVHAVTQQQASKLAGLPLSAGGLYYPDAGWVAPAHLCRLLLDHPAIECHFDTTVETLDHDPDRDQWLINGEQFMAPVVVVCTAGEASRLDPLKQLPLKPIRGQTTQAAAPQTLPPLKRVVCGEGYVSPPLDNQYCFGASFNLHDRSLSVKPEEQQANLELLTRAIPTLAESLANGELGGRVAFRATTPDYLPLVGAVSDTDWVLQRFGKLRDDANWRFPELMQHQPGLFVNTGHGAKGLISCPISGELIAALVDQGPLPVSQPVYEALNPVRFLIKNLIRRAI